jgi:DnaJ-class molecular chaperone
MTMPTTDPCPTCQGRGYQSQPPDADGPADERECPACGGDGVERLAPHESDEWTTDDTEEAA